ncbi:MAG TPA: hypothetical protein VLK65_19855 [Vicinamibacteria bacterium]|nr:hypothetical protein [Vicinamibacteria bacterium]
MSSTTNRAILVGLGLVELALAAAAARFVDREAGYPFYLSLYLAMGLPWLLASYHVVRHNQGRAGSLGLVFFLALSMRASFLFTEPVLSDDIYRYLWDGRVAHAGINPYRYAPEAPELALLRNEDYGGINNKDIPTIYPPLMQVAFFAVTSASESVLAMKAFFVVVDVALLGVLIGILRAASLNPERVLVYAWSPLAIVEIAGSGHNDVLGALFLMAALAALGGGKERRAPAWMTLSGLAKLVGFAVLPLLARQVKKASFIAVPLLVLAFSLPYASAGRLAFRGLREYGLRWRGNDSLFHVLYAVTGSLEAAKLMAALVVVLLVATLVFKRTPPRTSAYWTVGAVLLLSPIVHPWYLLWIAPFLCLRPSPAWMFLSLSVGLSYHSAYLAEPGRAWEDIVWVKGLEYGPFFFLALMNAKAPGREDAKEDTG